MSPKETNALPADASNGESSVSTFIPWLLAEERELTGVPFAKVVAATANVRVTPFNPVDADHQRILRGITEAIDAMLAELRQPGHPVHEVGRINEVSGHLEELLLTKLNLIPDFSCTYPPTAEGRLQRSGYPDLRLLDRPSGQILYLDPKLYAAGSESSTFRTFYFEPKRETNKILDDAIHLIVGIAHGGRLNGAWTFLRWNLVDLHDFEVSLKAEFQSSNRNLYHPESIIAESEE